MPPSFSVTGGRALKGTIRPAGNKNAALPILAATLLADGPCRIDNVPHIRDVETMLALLVHLGADVRWLGPNSVEVNTARAEPRELDPALCARIRASILLAGPMLARFGRVSLPPPGGDVIGRRRVDTHFLALERLGAEVTIGAAYQLEVKSLTGADIFLDETSVTATENALMAAVAARGTTTLRNAACEPHVQDLARFLSDLGAKIQGVGTNTLTIEGGSPLSAAACTVGPDHIEIGSFIGLAAVTNGAITIDGVRSEDLRSILLGFERLGVRPRLDGTQLIVDAGQERRIRPDLGGHVPKLEDGPWPAFPADLMSIAIVVASQCEGILLIFEKLFESRLFFVDKLIGMGARIVLCDPHRAVIAGPAPLHGGVVDSPDIRAGRRRSGGRADGRSVKPHVTSRPPDRPSATPPLLREVSIGDSAVPRMELAEWAARYGVVAGITTRGHGFSLGLWSEENVGQVMSRWRAVGAAVRPRFPGVVLAHQVHGTTVQWHPSASDGWLIVDGVDGHATGARGLLLTVTVADCIPVYLAVPQKHVVALLHSGWRGTAAGILERGVELVKRMAFVRSSDIVMHCGVGVCGECYEVGSEVLSRFTGRAETGPGQVDLRAALARQGQALGLGEVTVSAWCSAHDREHFFSHRASGGRDGRMIAYAGFPLA